MKRIISLLILLVSLKATAQWPGSFYAFELKDPDGKNVDSLNKDYKLVLDDKTTKGPAGIKICADNKTWRFYKGDKNLYITNSVIIERSSDGSVQEKMILNFPPPMTGGKEKYYSNLYLGEIKFTAGTFTVKLPETGDEWDSLTEIEICPIINNYNKYLDISKYQKQ